MQDKIILGLLFYKKLTSYDMKKAMEKSTSFFYNSSLGSINPALIKLEKNEFVTFSKKVENGRAVRH